MPIMRSNLDMEFAHYVESFQSLYLNAKNSTEPVLAPLSSLTGLKPRKILILAPHPDDECLMGGLALRAKEEFQTEVCVVPFTFGSKVERRAARKVELENACKILGFDLLDPRANGVDDELRESDVVQAITGFQPDAVIAPHSKDGHPVHQRASSIATAATQIYANKSLKRVHVFYSEFWQSMEKPNFVLPLSAKHISTLGRGLEQHVGEVSRNPYHLTLPAWAMDQIRRGSEMRELPKGKNSAGLQSVDAVFGQIYRLETLTGVPILETIKIIPNQV
jgi:LmbE family N-acetylglucosaminyl deacetylase